MENHNRKKREAEEEERQRLLKLVEQQYRYKSDTYDSATAQPVTVSYEPLKDHSSEVQVEEVNVGRDRCNTMNSIGKLD